ncbi:MAG: hypothetical protein KC643_31565 [Nitrospira sp.]|nr:hypothetical protein [Nitrospira sp.]
MIHPPPFSDLLNEWIVCTGHPISQFCQHCSSKNRMFRVFVEYLRHGKTTTDLEKRLPPAIRKLYLENRPQSPPSYTLATHHGRTQIQKKKPVEEDLGVPSQMLSQIPQSENPASFHEWLLLAWCLRLADHQHADRNKEFKQTLSTLIDCGLAKEVLWNLTFLPAELVRHGKDLRNFMRHLREDLSSSIRCYKQKIRLNPSGTLKGPTGEDEEEPASREWETRWLEQFGIEKNTLRISLQYIWTWQFVPLVINLLPVAQGRKHGRPMDSPYQDRPFFPDEVCQKASQLIHLRYPTLWSDNWQRVRERCRPYVSEFCPDPYY